MPGTHCSGRASWPLGRAGGSAHVCPYCTGLDRLAGEPTFNDQSLLRGRAALGHFGVDLADGEEAHGWLSAYSRLQPSYMRAFEDVLPLLDQLDAAGIPYGAVSNNVHDYQRPKLDGVGLERIMRLVGTDTLGVAKPEPAIYLEGVRLLGTLPEGTLYVGDNRMLDAEGSTAAGLVGVWLKRVGSLRRISPDTRSPRWKSCWAKRPFA